MNENKYICPFCGRNDFKRKEGLTYHIKHCKQNPDRVDVSDETRQKMSEAHKGKPKSEETKQKLSETIKRMWENLEVRRKISEAEKGRKHSVETKQKMSEAQKIAQNRPEVKKKLSDGNKGKKRSVETKQKISEVQKIAQNRPEVKQKRYNTLKQNNSFNTSKIEEQLKEYLTSHNINFKTQYKNELYPFNCDFYLPKYDLYIEIQGHWSHGGKPFDSEDPDCIKHLEMWKSKNTKFYDNAINTWTIRDVKKRETAKINNLNWIEIFSNDLNKCLEIISNKLM